MAVDEALLASIRPANEVTIRFYGWLRPTVSLGYAQPWATGFDRAVGRRYGMHVVRRRTGGRAVLHAAELTYSVTGDSESGPLTGGIQATYNLIARGFARGFARLGVEVEVVRNRGRQEREEAGACFAARALNEIVADSRKLVGSAQRRASGRVLQHGSILLSRPDPVLWRVLGTSGPAAAEASVGLNELVGAAAGLRRVQSELARGLAAEIDGTRRVSGLSGAELRLARRLRYTYLDSAFTHRR